MGQQEEALGLGVDERLASDGGILGAKIERWVQTGRVGIEGAVVNNPEGRRREIGGGRGSLVASIKAPKDVANLVDGTIKCVNNISLQQKGDCGGCNPIAWTRGKRRREKKEKECGEIEQHKWDDRQQHGGDVEQKMRRKRSSLALYTHPGAGSSHPPEQPCLQWLLARCCQPPPTQFSIEPSISLDRILGIQLVVWFKRYISSK